MPLHVGKGRDVSNAISRIIDYVENPQKTDNGRLISCYECDSRVADAEFALSKRQYKTITGRTQENDVIAYHFRQSFLPGEVTAEEANRIGQEFAHRFLKDRNAFIICTHIDKEHIHNHIIWNSTALDCTRKFRNFWHSTRAVRILSDTICVEHGLSIIENPKPHGKSYNKWLGDRAKPSNRDQLRAAIDDAIAKEPEDFNAFLALMQSSGYSCKRGKNLTFSHEGQRNIRLSSLGDGYSEAELRSVIGGCKAHTPHRKRTMTAAKPTLLSDIEAKLNSGKGRGYEQWTKVFRLKEMAKTVLYLQEHNFVDVNELQTAASSAGERYHDLSKQIKAAETRMAEIAVLKTHVINYAKTREVFAEYKASKYFKAYLEQHEPDILLHRAAKKAFNELGLKKLPTIKSLQQEYGKLMAEKKALYAEYKKARDEMRELATVKGNVSYILGADDPNSEHDKEQRSQ